MTPELSPLPDPLPARLRWTHTRRRTAWLFDGSTCVGSLGFAGYGRASGLTSRGLWHLHRRGVLHLGVQLSPADGRHPPLVMHQGPGFDGRLDMAGIGLVEWRALDGGGRPIWTFDRADDGARLMTFGVEGEMDDRTAVEVMPEGRRQPDPTPLLLLGAFLVRLAVDDSVVLAGA